MQMAMAASVDPFSASPFSVGFDPGSPFSGSTLGQVQLAQQTAAAYSLPANNLPVVQEIVKQQAEIPVPQLVQELKEAQPVSLLKDLARVAAPLVGGLIGGPAGAAVGGVLSSLGTSAPGSGAIASMAALPSIGTTGAVVGTTVRAGIAGARAVIASARYYCAKYPGWCISIGGLGAVQGMVQNGQLPVHRRRRGRGISARDFRGFRRVHNILSGFCAPRMRVKRRALGKR